MTFRHDPLKNADHIRLFTLRRGKFDDELVGSVRHSVFLGNDSPCYNFLSYARKDDSKADASLPLAKSDRDWDREDNSRTIKINGQSFKLGHNLALALVHLRSREHDQCFWIDSICLNIKDEDEISSQVYLMPTIVAQAEAVISWLGPDEPEQFWKLKSDEDKWMRMKINWGRGKTKFLPSWLGKATNGNFNSTHRQYIPTDLLGKRNYWSRIRTLQELLHARNVFFVSGRSLWLESDFYNHMDYFETLPIVKILNARRDRDKKFPLETLLLEYHSYQYDDRLDLVYALIGLSSDICATRISRTQDGNSSNPKNTNLSRLTIDYKRTSYAV